MSKEMSSEERKHVITKEGWNLGEMVSYNIDASKWMVTSLIVELHRDMIKPLNVKKPFLGKAKIRIKTDQIVSVGDVIQLSMDLETLRTHL
jgi:sporulation protein YlmC with PRC-barrel domain